MRPFFGPSWNHLSWAVILTLPFLGTHALRADLVTHLTFDGTLEDEGPGGNEGVFFGDLEPTYANGFDGGLDGAILFDGVDDYVRLTNNQGLPISNNSSFSIAMWVKGDGTIDNVDDRVFSETSSTEQSTLYTLGTHQAGTGPEFDFLVRAVGGQNSGHRFSTGAVFDDSWHHVAWVDDNGAVTLYIDGILDMGDFNYDTALRGVPDTTTIGVVRRDSHATIPDCCLFTGAIDDVRLYDHALTQEEVCTIIECVGCPEDGDTHCDDFLIDGPIGGGPGLHTITALDALDESGDAIFYSFRADNGMGTVFTAGPQLENFAEFTLDQGSWTITVTVDDDLNCDDVANDATCSRVLDISCPADGDTHCDDLFLEGPDNDTPGTYTVTALDAVDESGDPILYTFTADNGEDPPLVTGPTDLESTMFTLSAGNWTLSVTVDDDPLCDDEAGDATCSLDLVIDPVPPGLISHWNFDGDLDDSQPAANDGMFFGDIDAIFVEGFDGNLEGAVAFDGLDDYVDVFQNSNLPIYAHKTYTVAFWVKGPPGQPDLRVFSEGSNMSNAPLLNIGTDNTGTDGTLDIYIRGDNGQAVVPHLHSVREAFDNDWHHVTWVDDNGKGIVYIDAIRDETNFSYVPTRITVNTTSIGGILRAAPSHWFQGEIDDVRVYNHALSLEEIEALVPEREGCPGDADTTCGSLTVEAPPNNYPGLYRATAIGAQDATGDPIIYTFTAENTEGDHVQRGPGLDDSVELRLTAGTWTFSVTVDDDLRCRDQSENAVCTQEVEVVNPPPALVSHWKFDGDLTDSGEAGNDAVVGGGAPVFTEDRDGNPGAALSFDGIDDFVLVAEATDLPIYNNITVEAYSVAMWVKGPPQNDRRVYSESTAEDNNPLFNIGTQQGGTTGQVDIFIRPSFGHRLSEGTAFDDSWHHIAWVDHQGDALLYIDGQPDATDFSYVKPELPLTMTTIGGILRAGPCCLFDGEIDDVRVYNYALSAEEVQGIFGGEIGEICGNEVDDDGDTLVDCDDPDCAGTDPCVTGGFVRGDSNADGSRNITDGVFIFSFLFTGGQEPPCKDAADTSDQGSINITSGIYILNFLFLGGPEPPAPFPECGADPTAEATELGCESFPPCEP